MTERGDRMSVSAIVLAGGRSTRMGRDKASVSLAGRTLLEWTLAAVSQTPGLDDVVLVLAADQQPSAVRLDAQLTVVRDRLEAEGPLAAIAAGLEAMRAPVSLVVGCDTPFVRPALLQLLVERASGRAIVVPVYEGRVQPLCAAIRRDALPAIQALLAAGIRAASSIADDPRALRLEEEAWRQADPAGVSFLGINTPEELALAEQTAARWDGESPGGVSA